MIIPAIEKHMREREYQAYSSIKRIGVVYAFLFKGLSYRKMDQDVLGLDPKKSKGYQSMGILHYLGLTEDFKGVFKDISIGEAITALDEKDDDSYLELAEYLKEAIVYGNIAAEMYNFSSELGNKIKLYGDELSKEKETELENLRKEFVEKFPIEKMDTLSLNSYALGTSNYKESFCYWMENRLSELGEIKGAAPASKFAVYYGIKGNDKNIKWRWTKWTNQDFSIVRKELCSLLEAGKRMDLESISNNRLSPTFKNKILACYYPDNYLNIYSKEHVTYFLRKAYGDFKEYSIEEAQSALINYKKMHPVMRDWSNIKYTYFLYAAYRVREITKDRLEDETISTNGLKLIPIETKSAYKPIIAKNTSGKKSEFIERKKPNYEVIARHNSTIGKKGESAVFEFEKERLIFAGRADLAEKVKWISLESDSYGYDIKSYDKDGNEKHIEVKTSKNSINEVNFYISAYEYEKMCSDDRYEIYYVYNLKSKHPKVYILDCKMLKEKFYEIANPVTYAVSFTSNDIN